MQQRWGSSTWAITSIAVLVTLVALAGAGVADDRPTFEVSIDEDATDRVVRQGEMWRIAATVTNTGDQAATQDVFLGLGEHAILGPLEEQRVATGEPDDTADAVQEIHLGAGVSEQIVFEVTVPARLGPGESVATVATLDEVATVTGIVADASVRVDPELDARTGRSEVIVRLQPVDPRGLEELEEPLTALKDHAATTQQRLVDLAEREDAITILNRFWLMNAAVVEVDHDADGLLLLSSVDEVTWIHANLQMEPMAAATDGGSGDQASDTALLDPVAWGLAEINAPDVWDTYGVRGEGARVAVLDTGIDADHDDLNLHTDDASDPTFPGGWIEFDPQGDPIDGSQPYDDNGHGTHVSGTVAGGSASGAHIGVAPEVELLHAGVLTPLSENRFAAVVAGMEWAAEQQADVTSMSLGSVAYVDAFIEPIHASHALGTFVVASAGNDGEGTSGSPANVHDVLAVGASDSGGDIASFSSGETIDTSNAWGREAPGWWPSTYVVPDVAAPGVEIHSSVPGDNYGTKSGTSMAAPHVSGTIALLLSQHPHLSIDQVTEALEATATKPGGSAKDTRYGAGIIDAKAAMDHAEQHFTGFQVEIIDTSTPVTEGEGLNATVTVTNGGGSTDTQTIRLTGFDGQTVDERAGLTLDPGEQATFNLTWPTNQGDAGFAELTVASDDLEAKHLARVFSASGDCEPLHPAWFSGQWTFTATNGITRGQGTAEDPYVLERWCIEAGADAYGLILQGTSAHVEIRDNVIEGSRTGILVLDAGNVRIVNNTIQGNQDNGVWVGEGAADVRVEGNVIQANAVNGVVLDGAGSHATIRENTVAENSVHGLLIDAPQAQVVGNQVLNSGSHGLILWERAAGSSVTNNTISDSQSRGVLVDDGGSSRLADNTITGNGWEGITILEDSPGTVIEGNTLSANQNNGIFLASDGNTVTGNTMEDNAVHGVSIPEGGDGNTIQANEIVANTWVGILVFGDGNAVLNNTVQGNQDNGVWVGEGAADVRVEGNVIQANAVNGVVLDGAGSHATIRENTVAENSVHGLLIDAPQAQVVGNQVLNSGSHGLILWERAAGSSVTNNTISDSQSRGVLVDDGGSSRLADNTITDNGWTGIAVREQSPGTVIEGNVLTGNQNNGIFLTSDGNTVTGNTVEDSAIHGVSITSGSDGNTIEANEMSGNTWQGVFVAGNETVILDNTLRANEANGVWVSDVANGTRIEGNVIEDNSFRGIALAGGHATVQDNTIEANGANGLSAWDTGPSNTIANNDVVGNGNDGIWLDSVDNRVLDNTVSGNADEGLVLSTNAARTDVTGNTLQDNVADGIWIGSTGNEVRDNVVRANGDDGFTLWDGAEGNLIANNTISENQDDGIWLNAADNTFQDNLVWRNSDSGLVLSSGADGNTVLENTLTENEHGLVVVASEGLTVTGNDILSNTGYGLWAQDLATPLDVRENAWGAASGPSGGVQDCQTSAVAEGDGDTIGTSSAEVCFDPWLPPHFVVTILDVGDPVLEGDELEVTVQVENTRDTSDTQWIRLEDFDGNIVDTVPALTIEAGEQTTLTLVWQTNAGDLGVDDVAVASESDRDEAQAIILPNPLVR